MTRRSILALLLTVPLLAANSARPDESLEAAISEFSRHMAEHYGFEAATVSRLIPRTPNARVLAAIEPSATAEKRSWRRYRENFVNPGRIARGAAFWEQHADALDIAEARFGVPAEIIVAIIGIETNYGRQTGGFSALDALSTLAFHYPPRAPYFRRELAQFLVYAREQGFRPETLKGSYAGASGIPQFMPSSIRNYALDFDGDRRIDLANSPQDAIGSVAAFLQFHGWEPGGRIAAPARFPNPPPAHWLDAGIRPSLAGTLELWDSTPERAPEEVALIALRSPEGDDEYWWGFHNLYVISRYNKSASYSVATHLLADAIKKARHAAAKKAGDGSNADVSAR